VTKARASSTTSGAVICQGPCANYLCLLGWSPKDNREKLDIDEIIRLFDLKNVGRSSATSDPDKLHWLNGEYARELGDSEFYDLAVAEVEVEWREA